MSKDQPYHEIEIGHFPSDAFFGVTDDDRVKKNIDPSSYLYDEGGSDDDNGGGILVHNYGLFDQDECAAGELWDQADGTVFGEGNAVLQDFISMDGLVVIDELPVNKPDMDDADKWLAENDK
jgi:hypothetical protein